MDVMTINAADPEGGRDAEAAAMTIMVADDGDLIRKLVSMILTKEGHKVVESRNGKEALDLLLKTNIDILITDLNMPGMDGIELVKTIRSSPGLRLLPIVMLSSEFLEARKQKAYEAGINDWIPKPFIIKDLRDVLTKYAQEYCAGIREKTSHLVFQ
jgi:two-component system chemotaxis response regulator CheY